jgi:hypothetical protein
MSNENRTYGNSYSSLPSTNQYGYQPGPQSQYPQYGSTTSSQYGGLQATATAAMDIDTPPLYQSQRYTQQQPVNTAASYDWYGNTTNRVTPAQSSYQEQRGDVNDQRIDNTASSLSSYPYQANSANSYGYIGESSYSSTQNDELPRSGYSSTNLSGGGGLDSLRIPYQPSFPAKTAQAKTTQAKTPSVPSRVPQYGQIQHERRPSSSLVQDAQRVGSTSSRSLPAVGQMASATHDLAAYSSTRNTGSRDFPEQRSVDLGHRNVQTSSTSSAEPQHASPVPPSAVVAKAKQQPAKRTNTPGRTPRVSKKKTAEAPSVQTPRVPSAQPSGMSAGTRVSAQSDQASGSISGPTMGNLSEAASAVPQQQRPAPSSGGVNVGNTYSISPRVSATSQSVQSPPASHQGRLQGSASGLKQVTAQSRTSNVPSKATPQLSRATETTHRAAPPLQSPRPPASHLGQNSTLASSGVASTTSGASTAPRAAQTARQLQQLDSRATFQGNQGYSYPSTGADRAQGQSAHQSGYDIQRHTAVSPATQSTTIASIEQSRADATSVMQNDPMTNDKSATAAAMEEEMRNFLEKFNKFRSQDPETFSQVWQKMHQNSGSPTPDLERSRADHGNMSTFTNAGTSLSTPTVATPRQASLPKIGTTSTVASTLQRINERSRNASSLSAVPGTGGQQVNGPTASGAIPVAVNTEFSHSTGVRPMDLMMPGANAQYLGPTTTGIRSATALLTSRSSPDKAPLAQGPISAPAPATQLGRQNAPEPPPILPPTKETGQSMATEPPAILPPTKRRPRKAPPTDTIWPEPHKDEIVEVISKMINSVPANAGKRIQPEQILDMLSYNPSFFHLCEMIEHIGFKLDRASLSVRVLAILQRKADQALGSTSTVLSEQMISQTSHRDQQAASVADHSMNARTNQMTSRAAVVAESQNLQNATPQMAQASGGLPENQTLQQAEKPVDKPAKRPRGRPRKSALPQTPKEAQPANFEYAPIVTPSSMGGASVPPEMGREERNLLLALAADRYGGAFTQSMDPRVYQSPYQDVNSGSTTTQPLHNVNYVYPNLQSVPVAQMGEQGSVQCGPSQVPPPVAPPLTKEMAARKRTFAEIIDLTADLVDNDANASKKRVRPDSTNHERDALSGTPHRPSTQPNRISSQLANIASTNVNITRTVDAPATAPAPKSDLDVVEPISRLKCRRKSHYDPRTIARDVLIATGFHPHHRRLNAHLEPLLHRFSKVQHNADLSTLRWDLLDPGGAAPEGTAPAAQPPADTQMDSQVISHRSLGFSPSRKPVMANSSSRRPIVPSRGGGSIGPKRGPGRPKKNDSTPGHSSGLRFSSTPVDLTNDSAGEIDRASRPRTSKRA